jgi:hypothetical protein
MVLIAMRPMALDITEQEEGEIFDLLRTSGGMTPAEVASELRLDEVEVAIYLANQAGRRSLNYAAGEYSAWHWI